MQINRMQKCDLSAFMTDYLVFRQYHKHHLALSTNTLSITVYIAHTMMMFSISTVICVILNSHSIVNVPKQIPPCINLSFLSLTLSTSVPPREDQQTVRGRDRSRLPLQ